MTLLIKPIDHWIVGVQKRNFYAQRAGCFSDRNRPIEFSHRGADANRSALCQTFGAAWIGRRG